MPSRVQANSNQAHGSTTGSYEVTNRQHLGCESLHVLKRIEVLHEVPNVLKNRSIRPGKHEKRNTFVAEAGFLRYLGEGIAPALARTRLCLGLSQSMCAFAFQYCICKHQNCQRSTATKCAQSMALRGQGLILAIQQRRVEKVHLKKLLRSSNSAVC